MVLDALKKKYGSYAAIVDAYLDGKLDAAEEDTFESTCTSGELLIVATLRSGFARLLDAL